MVGSGSIANNEEIARYLDQFGLPYELLNAKNNEREAAIIAKAGEKGAITLATNMAGRGTDIKLGGNAEELIAELDEKIEAAAADYQELTRLLEEKETAEIQLMELMEYFCLFIRLMLT